MLVASSSAVNNVNSAKSKIDLSLEKLTTGSRINSASDDAAGLNMSTRQTTDRQSLGQAVTNINHGISLLHTADGALSTMHDIFKIRFE